MYTLLIALITLSVVGFGIISMVSSRESTSRRAYLAMWLSVWLGLYWVVWLA